MKTVGRYAEEIDPCRPDQLDIALALTELAKLVRRGTDLLGVPLTLQSVAGTLSSILREVEERIGEQASNVV